MGGLGWYWDYAEPNKKTKKQAYRTDFAVGEINHYSSNLNTVAPSPCAFGANRVASRLQLHSHGLHVALSPMPMMPLHLMKKILIYVF